jgi:hypothetical protein
MRRLLTARAKLGAIACAALVCGCSAILGDFSNGYLDGGGEDSGPGEGDSGMTMTGDGQVQVDGSTDATADTSVPSEDSGYDAPIDSYQPPVDAGPPGMPGTALTGGGIYAKSAHYSVITALGESPGGNLSASSANYQLQSGVIGAQ